MKPFLFGSTPATRQTAETIAASPEVAQWIEARVIEERWTEHRRAFERAMSEHRSIIQSAHEAKCSCGWSGPEANITAHLEEVKRDFLQLQDSSTQARTGS